MKQNVLQNPVPSFTRGKFWTTTMAMLLFFMVFSTSKVQGQIVMEVFSPLSNTTPPLATTYPSLEATLTALNAITGINGNVEIRNGLQFSETAPAKGFTIGSPTLNAAMAGNNFTITIDGFNATINAGIGTSLDATVPDGMVKLVGADRINFLNFLLIDNNLIGAAMMEFGIGLFKASATDGCNNNFINNNIIEIKGNNIFAASGPMGNGAACIVIPNSIPSAATSSIMPSSIFGANSFNIIKENFCFGGLDGISAIGSSFGFFSDYSNQFQQNQIKNFGTVSATNVPSHGIRASFQFDVNVESNNIDNNNGSGFNHIYNLFGIRVDGSNVSSPLINNNTVKLQSGNSNFELYGILNGCGDGARPVNITNNTIALGSATGTGTGAVRGIMNTSVPNVLNINFNLITGILNVPISCSGDTFFIVSDGVAIETVNTNQNIISGFDRTGASGIMYGIRIRANNWTASNNSINSLRWTSPTSAGNIFGTFNVASSTTNVYSNNNISSLTTGGTGQIYGIMDTFAGAKTASNNTIRTFSKIAGSAESTFFFGIRLGGTTNTVFNNAIFDFNGNTLSTFGIFCSSAGNISINQNKIYDLSSTSSNALVTGIFTQGLNAVTAQATIFNNVISGLTAPNVSATTSRVNGISINSSGQGSAYYNTVLLSGTSSGANFSSGAILAATTINLVLRNNIFINNIIPTGTGRAAAYFRSGTTLTSYSAPSNNNLFAGTSIFYDGTNTDATLGAFKTRMATRDQASVTEASTPFTSTVGSNVDFLRFADGVLTVANNNAIPITSPAITLDYFGVTRDTTTPDIGASEFSGTLENESFNHNSNLSVYPNPSRDVFFINSDARGSIVIYDVMGKIIKTENLNLGMTKLDLSNYPNGIYLMKVINDSNQTKTMKLIKQ